MLSLPGYTVLALFDEDARYRVYRGTDLRDGAPVILKTPQGGPPEPRAIERLRTEYDLLRELRADGVPRPRALLEHQRMPVLVLEDILGQRLDAILRAGPLPLARFFEIAPKLIDALSAVHRQQVIHRDLRPRNVVINASTGRLQIVDFGAASRLARELRQPLPPDQLEGTLAYISPEQTGRMNRAVDYRADFYALGATFCEMLTGEPPFTARHTLELVHCHLARTPDSPSERRPDVPTALSSIVLKLLAKLAEDRYQSLTGLRADLDRCSQAWARDGRVEPFTLGSADTSNRFALPQRLYGREAESRALLDAFSRVATSGRPELMLVAGYSGAGKSTLVAELHKPIVARRGLYIDGKVDQFRREVPYAALVDALRGLIQQVLAEPAARLDVWRGRIAEALGDSLQIIVDLVPQLSLIVGPQPTPPELPAEQAQHRLHRCVRQFISVFARAEHPLVLFLDDLQWIDAGTVALLVHLLGSPETRHLLVLGAYRDNEVGPDHALAAVRSELERRAVTNGCIVLPPLRREHVAQLVADTLHDDSSRVSQLADLVFAKTRGNPFFAFQFLTALHGDGYITYDHGVLHWRWDMQAIAARDFTDNVVELMLGEFQRLPAATREALALAGFLGNRFTRAALAAVGEQSLALTEAALRPALELGLLARGADQYRFLHDRIQEAAYALTPPDARALLHWRIGCRMHDGLSAQELDDACFEVAEHLNEGAATSEANADADHRLCAAKLNLRAGEKALASTAYPAASRHFGAGAAFLSSSDWDARHGLMVALTLGRAKSAWLTGDFDTADRLVEELQARASDDIEWASAAQIGIDLKVTQHDASTACDAAVVCLQRLGMDLPARPTPEQVQQAYDSYKALLADRPIESLAELPRMTDTRRIAAMRVIASVQPVIFFTQRELWVVQMCEMVKSMLLYGRTDASATGYAVFGFVLGTYFGDYRTAYRYGELAFDLMVRDGTPHYFASVQYHRALVGSWVRPLREVLVLERQALQGYIDSGDRLVACLCAHRVAMDAIMQGESLVALAPRIDEYLELANRTRYVHGIETLTVRRQQVRSLRGETRFLGSLADATFDEDAFTARPEPARAAAVNCWFHLARLSTACIAGDDARGHAAALAAEPWFAQVDGLLSAHDYYFYDALCVAGLMDRAELPSRAAWRERLARHEASLRRWSDVNPQTFGHSQVLVAAELARVDGMTVQAMGLYEQAISAARAHGFVQIEAIANERAARFYRQHGVASVADACVRAARLAYARWGAEGKLRLLDAQFPHLARSRREVDGTATTRANAAAQIDALAIVRAAQAITGQLMPDQLLRELLTIVLQQAGAQFGALLLVRGEDLELVATARGDGPRIVVELAADAAPGASASALPSGIVSYIRRSGERVLIDDARVPSRHSADAALAANRACSVLGVPIVRQARVTGVLYLEHRSAAHVFTLESVAVVEQLAAQAAISLETAQLYAELGEHKRTLEAKVEARTHELERSRAVLQTMLDGLPAMISMKDREGRYLLHNRQYADMMGRPGTSFVGMTIDDIVGGDAAGRVRSQDAQVLASESGLRLEEEIRVVGGPRTFQVHKFPVRDDQGLVHGVGAIAIDVTELKTARSAAEAAAEAKSQFLANMSHEIRTPMNAILGMAHLALRSGLNAQQHNYVQKVELSARSLLGLLNDILDFSKIEAGKLAIESRPFQLRDVLDNLDSVIGLQAAEKGLELIIDCAADAPTALVGDPLRLGQVLVNLGNNAVKFTDRGEVTVRIEVIERTAEEARLRFSMIDTGVGMSIDERQRLFTAFSQADASTSRRYGGTGLGLAISRELVQLLGGSIGVESESGRGSTFHFDVRVGLQPQDTEPGPPAPLQGSRVLVVDDNAAAARAIVAMCRELGWNAEAAPGGWDALRAVTLAAQAGDPIHLVLVDALMPGMDGVECVQRLTESDHGQRAVVLMCTPYNRDAVLKRIAAVRVMPSGLLAKPVTIANLRDVCTAALGARSDEDARQAQRVDADDATLRTPLRGVRMLLVEDNPINQELALELLRGAGVSVAVAGHGREAIEILERERFDGVLMDCQMPVMDGYEATREIRRRPEWADLPIIAMTANALASDQRKALAAGMNDHIAKPIDVATMYRTIARWVRGQPSADSKGVRTPPTDGIGTHDLAAMLPGIDTRVGLASTTGNEKLYRRLLVRFRESQSGFVASFRAARERGDPVGATRLAHDLRAVCGTLGAQRLEDRAQRLEAACRAGAGDAAIQASLAQVSDELAQVMKGLHALR